MWTIRQNGTSWEVADASGVTLFSLATYQEALVELGTLARTAMAAEAAQPPDTGVPTGALPRRWVSGSSGMVLAEDTGDGRDFTECTFSWRPLTEYPLPLMLQTTTDMGHFGAVLCGWTDTMALRQDGGVDSGGWFHDTDAGRQALTILEAQGRMGVSADPGEVTWEDVCTAYDVDGFCTDGYTKFMAYQVIGATLTPFPGFGKAWLTLDEAGAKAPDAPAPDPVQASGGSGHLTVNVPGFPLVTGDPVVVVASAPVVPPLAAFQMEEPPDDSSLYVDQGNGQLAIPLTILDDGRVFGHAAAWGTCHIGYRDQCVQPPLSSNGYADFHLGAVVCEGGVSVPTGTLVLGLDHAAAHLAAPEARDNYAHTGLAWADVRASNGRHGVWLCGMLRPSVTDDQLRVIRASSLSGDWRTNGVGLLELVAIQSVNVPGFPIARQALAAAGGVHLADVELRARFTNGNLTQLQHAGVVRPARVNLDQLAASGTVECRTCTPAPTLADVLARFDSLAATLAQVERRTRHLVVAERDALAARVRRS